MVDVGDLVAGKYRLDKRLGRGGMGVVFSAVHEELGKRVAIKFIDAATPVDDEAVARLKREAQAAAAIGHPSIIDVYDIGTDDDETIFLVMELLAGETLGECLAHRGTLDAAFAAYVAVQMLSALEVAHDAHIVHRDLKPENVFLVSSGRSLPEVKLLDFGISKSLAPEQPGEKLTRTGTVLGTPAYMAPEQARGSKELDHRVDLYAVGVILYEALTGRVPFEGENALATIDKILNGALANPRSLNADVPEALEQVVLRAMARDRDERYESASEMIEDLLPLVGEGALPLLSLRRHPGAAGAFDETMKVTLDATDARRLLVKAALLQSEKRLALGASLSLSDLERAAEEMGIDTVYVRQAAEELGLEPKAGALAPLGEEDLATAVETGELAPRGDRRLALRPDDESHSALREKDRAIVVERTIAARLSDEAIDRLISDARSEFATIGFTERTDGAVVWRTDPKAPRPVTLTLELVGQETRVRIVQDLKVQHNAALYLLGGSGSILGIVAALIAGAFAVDIGQQVLLSFVAAAGVGIGFGTLFGPGVYRRYFRHIATPMIEPLERLADSLVSGHEETRASRLLPAHRKSSDPDHSADD